VKSVAVADNSDVTAGAPLILLDDTDERIALDAAEAQVATQQATIERIGRQVLSGRATVAQASAELAAARAAADNAEAQFKRTEVLVEKSVSSPKELDATRAAKLQAEATVVAAEAAVDAATASVAVLEAQREEAKRVLDQYRLVREQTKVNLEHTIIRAPFDGIVGNRAAQPGEFVQPGQRLLAVVPIDAIYVDANFKETQVAGLMPGQTAAIMVDAYPDRVIEGRVESVSPASGSVFSLLPPDNATGNFTKIIQRVPVRIRLPHDVTSKGLIRPGMSIVAEVDTRTGPEEIAAR
jgi:membrane fusion protein (multidrug efflux system)